MTDDTQDLKNQQLLSAYLDGELGAADRALAESLIRENPHYAQLVEQWRESGIDLRALPKSRLDDGFADRVLNNIVQHDLGQGEGLRPAQTDVACGLDQSASINGANSRLVLLGMGVLCATLLLGLFVFPAMRDEAPAAAPVAANHGDLKTEPKPESDSSNEVTTTEGKGVGTAEEVAVSHGLIVRTPRAMKIAGANIEGGAVAALDLAKPTQSLEKILYIEIPAKDREELDVEQVLANNSIEIVKAKASDSTADQAVEAVYAVASVSQMHRAAEQLRDEFSASVTIVSVPVVSIELGNATRLKSRSFSSQLNESEIAELDQWFGLTGADDNSRPIRFLILLTR